MGQTSNRQPASRLRGRDQPHRLGTSPVDLTQSYEGKDGPNIESAIDDNQSYEYRM
jgi:hypothetical protein